MVTDKTLKCSECGKLFKWPAAEQIFYEKKGFAPPKRCRSCRRKLKKIKERGW